MAAIVNYFTFHDTTSTPSEGSIFLVDANTYPDSIAIETSGTATASIIYFEGQVVPGGSWLRIAGVKADDFAISTVTTKLNEFWIFDINSFYTFRINVSSVSGGYITVRGKITKTI